MTQTNDKNGLILSVSNLTVEFTAGKSIVHAVNDLSIDMYKGQTLGIVGETGAGKTTLANSIMQILPDRSARVTAGEIMFEGKNLLKLSEKELQKIRGKKISMIFQDPMTALNPLYSVGSQIEEAIVLHDKLSKAECRKKAEEMLEMVGIPAERFDEYPHQFSGGMKQRIVIAIALSCTPSLLIADEPTTALDVTIQAQILELIQNLKNELDTSVVLITHDLGIVAETCDRVTVVYAGEIVESGSVEQVFDNHKHPYTEGLFGSLPSVNKSVNRLKPIGGAMPDPTDLPAGCKFSPRCPYARDECRTKSVDIAEIEPGHFLRCSQMR